MSRFAAYNTDNLRRVSDIDGPFPFSAGTVTLLRISADGTISQASKITEKRLLLAAAADSKKDVVLAAWPGQWHQDIFVVDDLDAARAQLK